MSQAHKRTFVVYVEDRPGVLNRVTSLFRRRGYNIISLNVGETHEKGISRMTVVTSADDDTARILEANLYKMVNVLEVEEITYKAHIPRELALIKVFAKPDRRAELLLMIDAFRGRVVDVGPDTIVCEITGTPDKIESLVAVLEPFGLAEMVQTGTVAMTRGNPSAPLRHRRQNIDGS